MDERTDERSPARLSRRAPRLAALALCLLAPLLVAGCAARPETGALVATASEAEGAKPHKILVATTRARDPRPATYFAGARAQGLDYAAFTVSVPPKHVNGEIEWPSQEPGDPRTDFVVRDAGYLDSEKAFVAELNRRLAGKPKGQRKTLIFIHGYNTLFAEGLFRFAQVVNDAKTTAVPIHFSWASGGELSDYVYDTNSATSARDRLEHLFRLVAASDVDEINILAHSMGNWVTVEAMRNIKIKGDFQASNKVGHIVLAAPDIDIDVFKSQMRRIGVPKKPYLIILSKDDRALAASRLIAGGKSRVGDDPNEAELTKLGAVVVDLTAVKGMDATNHDKFAQIAEIAPELLGVLANGIGRPGGGVVANAVAETTGAAPSILSLPIAVLGAPIRILAGN
jgi:esterase/lipase superfamily enzyme